MPDLKTLNDIHAVHLTAVLRLSSITHLYIRASILEINVKKLRFRHELTANNTSKTAKITKR